MQQAAHWAACCLSFQEAPAIRGGRRRLAAGGPRPPAAKPKQGPKAPALCAPRAPAAPPGGCLFALPKGLRNGKRAPMALFSHKRPLCRKLLRSLPLHAKVTSPAKGPCRQQGKQRQRQGSAALIAGFRYACGVRHLQGENRADDAARPIADHTAVLIAVILCSYHWRHISAGSCAQDAFPAIASVYLPLVPICPPSLHR